MKTEELYKEALSIAQDIFVGTERGKIQFRKFKFPTTEIYAGILFPDSSYGYIGRGGYLGQKEKPNPYNPKKTIMVDQYNPNAAQKFSPSTPQNILQDFINLYKDEHLSSNKDYKYNE